MYTLEWIHKTNLFSSYINTQSILPCVCSIFHCHNLLHCQMKVEEVFQSDTFKHRSTIFLYGYVDTCVRMFVFARDFVFLLNYFSDSILPERITWSLNTTTAAELVREDWSKHNQGCILVCEGAAAHQWHHHSALLSTSMFAFQHTKKIVWLAQWAARPLPVRVLLVGRISLCSPL